MKRYTNNKNIILIIILLFSKPSLATELSLEQIRKLYYSAAQDKTSAEQLYKLMQNINETDSPVLLCYKGMAYVMQAKYSINPYNKWSYFNKGKNIIETTVKKSSQNIEIRFLRFCVQTNTPGFLNYNNHIESDKKIIINQWQSITDKDLKNKIKAYMLQSSYCNKAEKAIFE